MLAEFTSKWRVVAGDRRLRVFPEACAGAGHLIPQHGSWIWIFEFSPKHDPLLHESLRIRQQVLRSEGSTYADLPQKPDWFQIEIEVEAVEYEYLGLKFGKRYDTRQSKPEVADDCAKEES